MLAVEAAEITARRLAPLGLPTVVYPLLYGIGGTKDFASYALNYKKTGWLAIPAPRPSGMPQGYTSSWSVLVDACGATEPVARAVAKKVQAQLMHLSRDPTAYLYMGDNYFVDPSGGCKYVLTFMATLRQGE